MAGYTQKQAARIKYLIDKDVGTIEDAAHRIRGRVTDVSTETAYMDNWLEELREFRGALYDVVDRRTHA